MALEAILEAIREEAEAEAAEVGSAAASRVEKILEEADERAAAEKRRWAESRDGEAAQKSEGIVNRARLEADRRLAAAREDLFGSALERLRARLGSLTAEPVYQRILEMLYEEAATVVPDDDAVVMVRPADEGAMGEITRRHGVAPPIDPSLDCLGGLDIVARDGRAVRNTLDARLARSDRRLRQLAIEAIPEFASIRDEP